MAGTVPFPVILFALALAVFGLIDHYRDIGRRT